MIDVQADAMREEMAMRLGLPSDSDPLDVIRAVINMTSAEIYLSDLQAITRDMGGSLRVRAVMA